MIIVKCEMCGQETQLNEANAGHWVTCGSNAGWFQIPFTGRKPKGRKKQTAHKVHPQGLFHPQNKRPPSWSTVARQVIASESQWQASTDPVDLLTCALKRIHPHQLRRFSTACARQVIDQTSLQTSHQAVEVAEAWSHGVANDQELDQAERKAWTAWQKEGKEVDRAARSSALADIGESVITTSLSARTLLVFSKIHDHCKRWEKEVYPGWLKRGQKGSHEEQQQLLQEKLEWEQQIKSQAHQEAETLMNDLMLDVFGNPFRPVHIPETWLGKHQNTVVSLAHYIYHEQRFEEMPILGDALEDAACPVEEVLEHCRKHPIHARGCYVLEALLWPSSEN